MSARDLSDPDNNAASEGTSTEVEATRSRVYDDSALSQIKSFSDMLGVGDFVDWSDYGNGFDVLPTNDKSRLVGVPFGILEWRFNKGDNGDFVSALVVTEKDEKIVLNDGSTGIRDQLLMVTERRVEAGTSLEVAQTNLLVKKGLRESRYFYTDEKTGEQRPAVTYYLG